MIRVLLACEVYAAFNDAAACSGLVGVVLVHSQFLPCEAQHSPSTVTRSDKHARSHVHEEGGTRQTPNCSTKSRPVRRFFTDNVDACVHVRYPTSAVCYLSDLLNRRGKRYLFRSCRHGSQSTVPSQGWTCFSSVLGTAVEFPHSRQSISG